MRVRSVQVHDRPVERAEAGQRVALAVPRVERREIRRGDVLVEPHAFTPSFRLDVELDELEPVGRRVTVHHGTTATPARVVRLGDRFAQLRLSAPVVAARGDRVILRRETTVGGGVVLDPAPPRHADANRLELLARGELAATVHAPVPVENLRRLGIPAGVEQAGGWAFSQEWLAELRAGLERELDAADPLDPGIDAPSGPWSREIVPLLRLERRGSRLYRPGATPDLGALGSAAPELERTLASAGLAATKVDDRELARHLEAAGALVRLGDGYAVSREAYEQARALVAAECDARGSIALARFRDLAGIGRRDAQLLLERLDADGVTRRAGDARVLRRRSARS